MLILKTKLESVAAKKQLIPKKTINKFIYLFYKNNYNYKKTLIIKLE